MSIHYISKGDFPPENKYVLIYCSNSPWRSDDHQGVFWKVARIVKGISIRQREEYSKSNDPMLVRRSKIYRFGDEQGNNTVPYEFEEFGPSSWFGQNIDLWADLPHIPLSYKFKITRSKR